MTFQKLHMGRQEGLYELILETLEGVYGTREGMCLGNLKRSVFGNRRVYDLPAGFYVTSERYMRQ